VFVSFCVVWCDLCAFSVFCVCVCVVCLCVVFCLCVCVIWVVFVYVCHSELQMRTLLRTFHHTSL